MLIVGAIGTVLLTKALSFPRNDKDNDDDHIVPEDEDEADVDRAIEAARQAYEEQAIEDAGPDPTPGV